MATPPSQSPEALLRAMAPIDKFLAAFISSFDDNDSCTSWAQPDVGQTHLAALVAKVATPPFVPTRRYLRLLLTRYDSKMEREADCQIEDEALAELIAVHAFGPSLLASPPSVGGPAAGSGMGGGDAPDPDAYGYVSFQVPQNGSTNICTFSPPDNKNNIVGIRVYPHHNDVGIRKVWEAGACLAEFLIEHPALIRDKKVLELGAGVGLTGIVAAGLCQAKHLHMTDYTEACLDNMEHNITVNKDWLVRHGVNVDDNECSRKLTSGYLEWTECVEGDDENSPREISTSESFQFSNAEVLLAADVVYDASQIPSLVRSVKVLLSPGSSDATSTIGAAEKRKAIFATTFRNEKTFALFTSELRREGISCNYVEKEAIASLPNIFPCYFTQPRSDVRICTMTMD